MQVVVVVFFYKLLFQVFERIYFIVHVMPACQHFFFLLQVLGK